MKKILIVSDAWEPQISGVVRTLKSTIDQLTLRGFEVKVIHPYLFSNFPLPGYKEISIPYNVKSGVEKFLKEFNPDYIHIAVESVLGIAARKYCIKHNLKFTTAYHTKFPEFVESRLHIPSKFLYPFFKNFHSRSARVLVTTPSMKDDLSSRGFRNLAIWGRGVDTKNFIPCNEQYGYALYVGRVSHEKSIRDFLDAKTDLYKVVVGDGPQLQELKREYPQVFFAGAKKGKDLVDYYQRANVFVFPSKTDTFGLVLIEALSCGVPIAAYPVTGPIDIVTDEVGCLNNDLSTAINGALTKNRSKCRQYALDNYTWEKATDQFIQNLVPANS